MKNSKILFLIAAGLFVLSSCAPVYIPTMHNVPVLKEKGDIQVQAWAGSSGFDIQASQMTGEKTAVMGSLSAASGSNENRHLYAEGGYGIVHTKTRGLTLSGFGGLAAGAARGKGIFTVNGTAYERIGEATVLKPFIQGNLGFQSDYLNIGLSTRLAYLQFLSLTVDNQKQDPPAYFFTEPVAYMHLGGPRLKAMVDFGLSFPLGNPDRIADYVPIMFGVGLQYIIPAK